MASRLHGLALFGIWYAVALHLAWTGLLCWTSAPRHVTGIYALTQLFPNRLGLAIILLAVAVCASGGVLLSRLGPTKILLLVPQQLVLGISASGAIRAMFVSHYADGTSRPRAFLIADQLPTVLALAIHSATILYLALLAAQHDRSREEWQ